VTQRVPLLVLFLILATGCVDARTSVNTLTASVVNAVSSTEDLPAGDRAQPAVLEFTESDVVVVEPDTAAPLPVSAFGLRWIASGVGSESIPVRDQPGLASAQLSELEPWSADFWVAERVRRTADGPWRFVTLADGSHGWVLAQSLLAQPPALEFRREAKLRRAAARSSATGMVEVNKPPLNLRRVSVEGQQLIFDWSGGQPELLFVVGQIMAEPSGS
jgi:hypothetical protein